LQFIKTINMIIIQSYFVALIMIFITMLCWGSWANTQKLASKKWRFQLFYWDYALGVLLVSLLLAFTMGSVGNEGRSFIPDLAQADPSSLWSAFLGGVVFNLANILLVVAIDIAGMAVAFPVGIGIALVWGVVVNYIKSPVGNPLILFIGVAAVAIAIIINALAYKKASGTNQYFNGLFLSFCGSFNGREFCYAGSRQINSLYCSSYFFIGIALIQFYLEQHFNG
jgi:glucose uptake protein